MYKYISKCHVGRPIRGPESLPRSLIRGPESMKLLLAGQNSSCQRVKTPVGRTWRATSKRQLHCRHHLRRHRPDGRPSFTGMQLSRRGRAPMSMHHGHSVEHARASVHWLQKLRPISKSATRRSVASTLLFAGSWGQSLSCEDEARKQCVRLSVEEALHTVCVQLTPVERCRAAHTASRECLYQSRGAADIRDVRHLKRAQGGSCAGRKSREKCKSHIPHRFLRLASCETRASMASVYSEIIIFISITFQGAQRQCNRSSPSFIAFRRHADPFFFVSRA